MALGGNDLLVTTPSGEKHGYIFMSGNQYGEAIVHSKTAPSVSGTSGNTNPAQAGGPYDARDSDGDKAISHLDWTLGAGQMSLDFTDAYSSKYKESRNIEISRAGEFSLLKKAVTTEVATMCGPVYSGAGVLWMGYDSGALKYSADSGATWTAASITASPSISASIDGFCTDGTRMFFCVSAGANMGVWVNSTGTPYTFAKYGSGTPTASAIQSIAFYDGKIFACNSNGAGHIATTGVYTQVTTTQLDTFTSVTLRSSQEGVYWVCTQNGQSYVYKISYDPPTSAYVTEQYMEMPRGFTATCAVCYLSMLYIGGYWVSNVSSPAAVGRGSVYVVSDNFSAPLFSLGDYPEDTHLPTAPENDNRIYGLCAAGKDLYAITNRACYRWDIDGSGYSHVFDHLGCGAGTTSLVWKTDSLLSWDGSNLYVEGSHPKFYPNGWTASPDTVGDWEFTGASPYSAKYKGANPQVWSVTPPTAGDKDAVLSNTSGTSIQFDTTANSSGDITVDIRDGTRQAIVKISPYNIHLHQYGETTIQEAYIVPERQLQTNWSIMLHQWIRSYVWVAVTKYRTVGTGRYLWSYETPIAGDTLAAPTLVAGCALEKSVLIVLKGNNATMSLDGGVTSILSSALSKANAATNQVQVTYSAGATVDSMVFNSSSSGAVAGSSTFRPSIAKFNGRLVTPYNDRSLATPTVGQIVVGTSYAATGQITQSKTTFHSGSLLKDFRYISVSHAPLPADTTVDATWSIDGEAGAGTMEMNAGRTESRIYINQRGYSIENTTTLTSTGAATPIGYSVNVVWDFVKTNKHSYLLQCASNIANGRWREDPLTAIAFLFDSSDRRCTFEDIFSGPYTGNIETIQYIQASSSDYEGPSGIVRIEVREAT